MSTTKAITPLTTQQNWPNLLEDQALTDQLLNKDIPAYFQTKRWFGAKSAKIKKYEIEGVLRYDGEGKLVYLLMIEVIFMTSNSDTYFLPLSFEKEGDFEEAGKLD